MERKIVTAPKRQETKSPEVKSVRPLTAIDFLKPEAFAEYKIQHEDIDVNTTLKHLYGADEKPIYVYDEKEASAATYKEQFKTLMDNIYKWAEDNKLDEYTLINLDEFYEHFFDVSKNEMPYHFEGVKKNLEVFYHCLTKRADISLQRKVDELTELARELRQCSEGIRSFTEKRRLNLESPTSMIYWLADIRTQLLVKRAGRHIIENKIPNKDREVGIHAGQEFKRYAITKGWAPLSEAHKTNDRFRHLAKVTPEILTQYSLEFPEEYLNVMADELSFKFKNELEQRIKDFVGIKENKAIEWVPFDDQIVNLERTLLAQLELKGIGESTLELKEESGKFFLKIRPDLFKKLFLRYCYEQNRYISKEFWQTFSISDEQQLFYPKQYHYPDLAWMKLNEYSLLTTEIPSEHKERYYAYAWPRYKTADPFHLTSHPEISLVHCFPTEKSFIAFIKKIETENRLLENTDIFKSMLDHNRGLLLAGLSQIKEENVIPFLSGLGGDFSLLHERDPLHDIFKSLSADALNAKHVKLAQQLTAWRENLLAKKADFFHVLQEEQKENPSRDIRYSDLVRYADQATLAHQELYYIALKQYFPQCVQDIPIKDAAKAFKIAHEKSISNLDDRFKKIISLVKDGDAKGLEQSDFKLQDLFVRDYYAVNLLTWARRGQHGHLFNYWYELAGRQYPVQELKGNLDLCQGYLNAPLLYWAALLQQQEKVQFLLEEKADPNKAGETGLTALHAAGYSNHLGILESLIKHRADVNAKSNTHHSPLSTASACDSFEAVQFLIAHHAEIHASTIINMLPILQASDMGSMRIVKFLVELGSSINRIETDHGRSPLYQAASKGYLDITKYLIEHHADVNQVTNEQFTPVNVASEFGYLEVVKYLTEQGADLNYPSSQGITPLFVAADNGHFAIVQYLIEQHSNVNQSMNDGKSPLYGAAGFGHKDIVEYLIAHSADVNQRAKDGMTPIARAAFEGRQEVVALLLEKKADPTIPFGKKTPFDLAKDPEIKKLLLLAELDKVIQFYKATKKSLISNLWNKHLDKWTACLFLKNAIERNESAEVIKNLINYHPTLASKYLGPLYKNAIALSSIPKRELKMK